MARRLQRAKKQLRDQIPSPVLQLNKPLEQLRKNFTTLINTKLEKNESTWFAPVVDSLTKGLTPQECKQLFDLPKNVLKTARTNAGHKINSLFSEQRKATGRKPYVTETEKATIRQWIMQTNEQISNTNIYRYCKSSFKQDIRSINKLAVLSLI